MGIKMGRMGWIESKWYEGWHYYFVGQKTVEMLRLLPRAAYSFGHVGGFSGGIRFCFSGVYGPHSTPERCDLWDELAAVGGIWDGC